MYHTSQNTAVNSYNTSIRYLVPGIIAFVLRWQYDLQSVVRLEID